LERELELELEPERELELELEREREREPEPEPEQKIPRLIRAGGVVTVSSFRGSIGRSVSYEVHHDIFRCVSLP
jgi:hypothetical protein